jgi:carboxymethylenebutenolidase
MSTPQIGPTEATSENVNRRVFVGVSAAATLGAGAAAAAVAQEPIGAPHAPLVPENDPAISTEHVTLQPAGGSLPAYAAWPAGAGPKTPSVVVVMHVWGVDSTIRDTVRRYAKAGYAAIAPDLYGRFGAPSGDGSTDYTIFRPYAQKLDRAQYVGDLRAGAQWLETKFPGTTTGITGFCMGGRIALLTAIDASDAFVAVAPFYGPLNDVDPKAVRVPVCGSYGGRDKGIPVDEVRAFAAALTVPNDIKIYDEAGHAFFDDTRPSYVASAAADAWKRVLAFFAQYLRAAS